MNHRDAKEFIDRVVAECDCARGAEFSSELSQLEGLLNGLASYVYRRKEGRIARLRGLDPERATLCESKAKEALDWLREVHTNPNHRREVEEGLRANNARS